MTEKIGVSSIVPSTLKKQDFLLDHLKNFVTLDTNPAHSLKQGDLRLWKVKWLVGDQSMCK